jgi:hypothetical protein
MGKLTQKIVITATVTHLKSGSMANQTQILMLQVQGASLYVVDGKVILAARKSGGMVFRKLDEGHMGGRSVPPFLYIRRRIIQYLISTYKTSVIPGHLFNVLRIVS